MCLVVNRDSLMDMWRRLQGNDEKEKMTSGGTDIWTLVQLGSTDK